MAAIEVYRGAGNMPGEHVSAPMLSDAVLIERGRAEMDARAHDLVRATLDVVWVPELRLGQLVEAIDPVARQPMRGKIVGMQIEFAGNAINQQIVIEVPR